MERRRSLAGALCLSFVFIMLAGCRNSPNIPSHAAIRLAGMHKPENVEGRFTGNIAVPRTEWNFKDAKDTLGWRAETGISNLSIQNGMLTGKANGEIPLLHLERATGLQDEDTLHSIEIRMKASAGANLRIGFDDSEKFNLGKTVGYIRSFPFGETSPLLPGDTVQTYTLKPQQTRTSSRTRHILVIPTDNNGATFQIESLRLIFRKEYLANVPSGVSWQSLHGIYHETIVSRSPEVMKFKVRLPAKPWLDLSIGTIENGPVTFHADLIQSSNGKQDALLERTITRPHQWEFTPVELPSGVDGQEATLVLSISADQKGKIGFWGSPVVRSHRSDSKPTAVASGVIFIWADTLRRDHLDVYGYNRATAPNLRRLADEGALFQDCETQATWTKVASPSMATSLYPATHGVKNFSDRLPSSATTMAEVFENAGYATVSFSSNLFTATFSNFHQGFEELHEDSSLPHPDSSKTVREYMDRLLPWLKAHQDVPHFVFLHAYDAHDPYEPYAPYDTMWADPARKAEHERQLGEARKIIKDPLMKLFGMPNREEMIQARIDPESYAAYDRDWYDGSIRGMDAEFGRLFEYLRNSGSGQNTLVAFVGDHGEEFLEHGRMFHGQSVYGELTNIPLILWRPGTIKPKTVVTDTVETVDVMPTILELAGLKSPKGIQGQSLVSLLQSRSSRSAAEAAVEWKRSAFSEKAQTDDNNAPAPHDTESFAVVQGGWKLIWNTKGPQQTPEYELYEQNKDPLNRIDVAADHPEVVRRLSVLLIDWRKKTIAAKLKPDTDAAKGLSQEELERLRSLGYIQ